MLPPLKIRCIKLQAAVPGAGIAIQGVSEATEISLSMRVHRNLCMISCTRLHWEIDHSGHFKQNSCLENLFGIVSFSYVNKINKDSV